MWVGGQQNVYICLCRLDGWSVKCLHTLEFLINVQHVYYTLSKFSFLHTPIRNYTFINFQEILNSHEIKIAFFDNNSTFLNLPLVTEANLRDNQMPIYILSPF